MGVYLSKDLLSNNESSDCALFSTIHMWGNIKMVSGIPFKNWDICERRRLNAAPHCKSFWDNTFCLKWILQLACSGACIDCHRRILRVERTVMQFRVQFTHSLACLYPRLFYKFMSKFTVHLALSGYRLHYYYAISLLHAILRSIRSITLVRLHGEWCLSHELILHLQLW